MAARRNSSSAATRHVATRIYFNRDCRAVAGPAKERVAGNRVALDFRWKKFSLGPSPAAARRNSSLGATRHLATRICFELDFSAVVGLATERVERKRGKSRRARLSSGAIFAGFESGGDAAEFAFGHDEAFGHPNLVSLLRFAQKRAGRAGDPDLDVFPLRKRNETERSGEGEPHRNEETDGAEQEEEEGNGGAAACSKLTACVPSRRRDGDCRNLRLAGGSQSLSLSFSPCSLSHSHRSLSLTLARSLPVLSISL